MSVPSLDTAQKLKWKQELKNVSEKMLLARIAQIENGIAEARESANNEEKSTAGDKYETSRAMGHLQQEMLSKQMEEAGVDLQFIRRLDASALTDVAAKGAVVICGDIIFYLASGLGYINYNGHRVMLLSHRAPVALQLYGKKAGHSFVFNRQTVTITHVF